MVQGLVFFFSKVTQTTLKGVRAPVFFNCFSLTKKLRRGQGEQPLGCLRRGPPREPG